MEEGVAAQHGWRFRAKLRAHAYGWRGSALAVTRLKEAVSEIKAVAKSDPVTAGEGAVSLMERIWPAFQDIDTSSGALGTAVARTLEQLIAVLVEARADHTVRAEWLERLFDAVQEDGVQYLAPVEERWGEIARYPDLIQAYADRLLPVLRRAWADQERFSYVTGTAICLSCLLEAGRYAELQDLLATQRHLDGVDAPRRHLSAKVAVLSNHQRRRPWHRLARSGSTLRSGYSKRTEPMRPAGWCSASAWCGPRCSSFLRGRRRVWWRWRLVAGRTTGRGSLASWATRCG